MASTDVNENTEVAGNIGHKTHNKHRENKYNT
jgi:hypothetical protein